MNDIDSGMEIPQKKWIIDVNWFKQNQRSLSVLLRRCLCPECLHKYQTGKQAVTEEKLMKSIKDCCSQKTDFVSLTMPILESVFRLMLATGNRQLTVDEIMSELEERWEVSIYKVSADTLSNLLKGDQYYGLNSIDK